MMRAQLRSSLALVLCAWLASCAHMHRPAQDADEKKPRVARLVLVVCFFSYCRHLAQPDDGQQECPPD